jgi:hypothetical protein
MECDKMPVKFPPPEYFGPGLLGDNSEWAKDRLERQKQRAIENVDRMFLLCNEMGIEVGPSMWFELALTLARQLYPSPRKKGRKSKWSPIRLGYLVVELERLAIDGKSIEWAASVLSKREPWKSFIETKESDITDKDPGEALRKLYFKARNDKWAEVCRKAYKWHEINDDIASWEADVVDLFGTD